MTNQGAPGERPKEHQIEIPEFVQSQYEQWCCQNVEGLIEFAARMYRDGQADVARTHLESFEEPEGDFVGIGRNGPTLIDSHSKPKGVLANSLEMQVAFKVADIGKRVLAKRGLFWSVAAQEALIEFYDECQAVADAALSKREPAKVCGEKFIGRSDHFADECVLDKGHVGPHSADLEPVAHKTCCLDMMVGQHRKTCSKHREPAAPEEK